MPSSVYLVEDSSVLRLQIEQAVEDWCGLRFIGSSGDAGAAIQEILALKPDIIVVDLQLQPGSGWDVIDAVMGVPQQILILTNHASPPFRDAAKNRRIHHFFDKTSEFDIFLRKLEELA